MKITQLSNDLFYHIYSFLFELPFLSSSVGQQHFTQKGMSLSFAHSCSKILQAMDHHAPYQFLKFIQFYCLGITNKRFEQLQEVMMRGNMNEIVPVVLYLNIPPLEYVQHLNFDRDLIPLERKFRTRYGVNRRNYEDFFFKIDRIIEMLTSFINVIKQQLQLEELSDETEQDVLVVFRK